MNNITLKYDKYTTVSREPDMNDDWDRGDTETSWSFYRPILSNGYSGIGDYPADINLGDQCFVVVAVWSTGDSFGWDGDSDAEIFGAYSTHKEAQERLEELERDESGQVPWNGYFESLSYVEIVWGTLLEK